MLTISLKNGSTVVLQTGKKSVVIFPEAGAKPASDQLLLFGEPEESPRSGTVSWPGEYDIDGIAIRGIGQEEGKAVSYSLEIDNIHFGFLHSPLMEWSDYELELLGNIDVLCVPSDNPKLVQKIIDEIDPRVLIPINTGGAEKYAETLKACGGTGKEVLDKFVIKAGSLPADGRETVVLS